MTYVVGIISQKGGVGKSTISRALGCEAAKAGLKVKLADLDIQQGTIVNWNRKRLENSVIPLVSVESFKSAEQALSEANHYDLLILDGPARTSKATLEIAKAANLVVQPTGASVDDLEPAILTFHELVKATINRSKLVFALSRIGTDSEERDCRSYIEEAGYHTLHGYLPEKPAYRHAQNIGFCVTETKYSTLNKKAEEMIQSLVGKIENE
jgi:chromosome partitioning protein